MNNSIPILNFEYYITFTFFVQIFDFCCFNFISFQSISSLLDTNIIIKNHFCFFKLNQLSLSNLLFIKLKIYWHIYKSKLMFAPNQALLHWYSSHSSKTALTSTIVRLISSTQTGIAFSQEILKVSIWNYYYGIDTKTNEPKVTMLSYSQADDCFISTTEYMTVT